MATQYQIAGQFPPAHPGSPPGGGIAATGGSPLVPQTLSFGSPSAAGSPLGPASSNQLALVAPVLAPNSAGTLPDNWTALVRGVESSAGMPDPSGDVMTKVVAYFETVIAVPSPQLCPGIKMTDLTQSGDTWPTEALVYTCVRRVVSWLEIKEHARVQSMMNSNMMHASVAGSVSGGVTAINSTAMMEREHAENMDLMGHDHSALEVARLMGAAQTVDVADSFARVGMTALPHYLHGSQKLHNVLNADSEAARLETPARFPYTYIDLCHGHVLPMWIPQDLVGSKHASEEDHLYGGSPIDRL